MKKLDYADQYRSEGVNAKIIQRTNEKSKIQTGASNIFDGLPILTPSN